MADVVRITKSGWTASHIDENGLTLYYCGIQHVRPQRVIRYSDGTEGYDWPERVPQYVKSKVSTLLNKAKEAQ
jgi:hypothetical protein